MLKQRLCYGLPIAFVFTASMAFLPGPGLFVLLIAFAAACQWELYQLAVRGGYQIYPRLGVALGVLWMAAVYCLAVLTLGLRASERRQLAAALARVRQRLHAGRLDAVTETPLAPS